MCFKHGRLRGIKKVPRFKRPPKYEEGDLYDYDGNLYHYITIGNQQWIVENFKCEHYADGTAIPIITDSGLWVADVTGGMCYYNNDSATYKNIYGALYNHYAVTNTNGLAYLEQDGVQSLGWKVPTYADWLRLQAEVTENPGGGKLKEIGTNHWSAPNIGATDEYGFTAVGAGFRQEEGIFRDLKSQNYLWSSTEYEYAEDFAYHAILEKGNAQLAVTPVALQKNLGMSIRLMRDIEDFVYDYDGNVYTYVTIGTQQWMVENWRCEHYADGTPIPNLTESSYTQFLPSLLLLQEAYNNLKLFGVGGFSNAIYSSSSSFYEDSNDSIKAIDFTDGSLVYSNKADVLKVRPFMSFTDSIGAYSLRDNGPNGGLICYINGTTYYEAAAADIADSAWSNLTTDYLVTEEAISDSQTNTLAIINQVGHTNSAASLCNAILYGGWINDTTGAMCYYDNDEATYKSDYGALYNWYAVDNAHGLAPAGWRVPSAADFVVLRTALGGAAVAGGSMKEMGLSRWNAPNDGATNISGLTIVGSAARDHNIGSFGLLKQFAFLWTSTASSTSHATNYYTSSVSASLFNNNDYKNYGFSVRMMRDVV